MHTSLMVVVVRTVLVLVVLCPEVLDGTHVSYASSRMAIAIPSSVLIRVQCLDAEYTDTSRDVGTVMLVIHPLRVRMRSLVA